MDLNLTRPIIFFDIEATGLNVHSDRIVELAALKINPNGTQEEKNIRVNPTIPIEASALKVHGISNKDVENEPTFEDISKDLVKFFKGCDLAGYNSNKFDIPLLAEEFLRANVDFDLKKSKFVDAQVVFFKMEQRTLSAAYKYYCNKELKNAHNAMSDTIATFEILKAQLDRYPDLKNDVEFLSKFTTQTKYVDFAGRVIYNDKGQEVFNFGKYRGKPVEEIFQKDKGYFNWMMNGDFPLYTKKVLTAIQLRSAFGEKMTIGKTSLK